MKHKDGIISRFKMPNLFMLFGIFTLLNFSSITALYAAEANFLYKENDISVIRFSGNYDVNIPAGILNQEAGMAVSNAFYENNDDAYDFLIVFTQFNVEMGHGVGGFFSGVKNEVSGIGQEIYNNTEFYGSDGRLNGIIQMGGRLLDERSGNPLRAEFNETLDIIAHETLHNWVARIKFIDSQSGGVSDALLGQHDSHWNPLVHTGASLMYGAEWLDNGNGTFTAVEQRKFYSPLDLYLAGFNAKEEVPDFFYIDNASPAVSSQVTDIKGRTVSGIKKTVSIHDIIAHEGERVPSVEDAQKDFRFGVILLTREGQVVDPAVFGRIQQVRKEFPNRFSILTGGRARAHWYPGAIRLGDVGVSSFLNSSGDRLAAFSLEDGVAWLKAKQQVEGYWEDKEKTRLRDTAVVLKALQENDSGFSAIRKQEALDWLAAQAPSNNDSLARLLDFGFALGSNTVNFVSLINSTRNADGGWGVAKGYLSNPIDTALVIEQSSVSQNLKQAGIQYLIAIQNDDGGWGSVDGGVSRVDTTARVLFAFATQGVKSGQVVNDAVAYLLAHQDANFGFGDDVNGVVDSNIGDTALALTALYRLGHLDAVNLNDVVAYLSARQSLAGDWEGSVYTTALVVNALKGIAFGNWKVVSLAADATQIRDGERVQLKATVLNDGGSLLNQGQASFYLGNPDAGGVLLGSTTIPLLGAGQAVELLYYWDSFNQAGNHTLYVKVDPANLVAERLETDNTASTDIAVLAAPTGVELEIVAADITVLPEQISTLPTSLAMSANIRNFGQSDAGLVTVELWKKSALSGSASLVQTAQVLVNSRSNGLVNFIYELNHAGSTEFIVKVDPHNQIPETNKSNNIASVFVGSINTIDLAIESSGISLSGSAMMGQDVTFTVAIKNQGTVDSPSASIRYSIYGSLEKEIQLDSAAIPAGQTIVREIVWRVDEIGSLSFIVTVDFEASITESNENNNEAVFAFSTHELDGNNISISYEGIRFNPDPALQGANLTIEADVLNSGSTDLVDVAVSFYRGNPQAGGTLLGIDSVSFLAGEYASASVSWPEVDRTGTQLIYVVVDEVNAIEEIDEHDNSAFQQIAVITLPDLAIAEMDIEFSPAAPVTDEDFQVMVRIANIGGQSALNFPVSLYRGNPLHEGVLVETQTINELTGGAQHILVFDYSNSQTEIIDFYVRIDENGQVPEGNEFNNTASRTLAVQDSAFYVSSSYISPNADGVMDTLLLSFALPEATATRVEVLDRHGQRVRTIIQNEAQQAAQIIWDGKNDLGAVVNDGVYQLRLIGVDNAVIGSITTTVDTNHSSIKRAVFENDFRVSNLTCDFNGELTGFSKDGKYAYLYNNDAPYMSVGPQQFAQVEVGTGRLTVLESSSQGVYDTDFLGQFGDVAAYDNVVKNFVTGVEQVYPANIWERVGAGVKGAFFGVNDQYLFNLPMSYEEPAIGKLTVLSTGQTLINSMLAAEMGTPNNYYGGAITSANGRGLFVVADMDAHQPVEITGTHFGALAALIENGNYVAKLVDTATLTTATIDVPIEKGSDWLDLTIDASWSDDGSFIAISMPDQSIRIFSLQGELIQQFSLPSVNSDFNLVSGQSYVPWVSNSFSTDNKFMAFEVCQELSQEISVASLVFNSNYPGGYFHSSCGIFVVDLVSGELEQVDEHLVGGYLESNYDSPSALPTWVDTSGPLFASYYLNLRWLPGEHTLIYDRDISGEFRHVYLKEIGVAGRSLFGPKNYPVSILSDEHLWFSPDRQQLVAELPSPPKCLNAGYTDTYLISSPDNLLTDLKVISSEQLGGILLTGTATDINFAQWQLEYLLHGEQEWKLITSASTQPKRNEAFFTWIPDQIGSYLVRLTASDLAGNTKQVVKPVTWGTVTSISNLQFSENAISPNADGVQDVVEISFNVLQPTHLMLEVRNAQGQLVVAIPADYDLVGSQGLLSWSGRNAIGRMVEDGIYTISIQGYEFTVVVDNTSPTVTGEVVPLLSRTGAEGLYRYNSEGFDEATHTGAAHYLKASAEDELGLTLILERSETGVNHWQFVEQVSLLRDFNGEVIPSELRIEAHEVGAYDYRLVARDLAGNTTIQLVENRQLNQVVLASIVNHFEAQQADKDHREEGANPNQPPNVIAVPSYTALPAVSNEMIVRADMVRFLAVESIVNDIVAVQVLYRAQDETSWTSSEMDSFVQVSYSDYCDDGFTNCANWSELAERPEHTFAFMWNPEALESERVYFVRLKLTDNTGKEYLSNISSVQFLDGIQSTIGDYVVSAILRANEISSAIPITIEPADEVMSVSLFVQSSKDARFSEQTELETIYFGETGFNADLPFLAAHNFEINADSLLPCTDYSVLLQYELFSGRVLPESSMPKTITTNCLSVYYFLEPKIPQQCGMQSHELNVHLWPVAAKGFDTPLQSLSIERIQENGVRQVLFNQNTPVSGDPVLFTLDRSEFEEGDLELAYRLIDMDSREWMQTFTVPVDKSAPSLNVYEPQENQQVCASRFSFTEQGKREVFYAADVKATVSDTSSNVPLSAITNLPVKIDINVQQGKKQLAFIGTSGDEIYSSLTHAGRNTLAELLHSGFVDQGLDVRLSYTLEGEVLSRFDRVDAVYAEAGWVKAIVSDNYGDGRILQGSLGAVGKNYSGTLTANIEVVDFGGYKLCESRAFQLDAVAVDGLSAYTQTQLGRGVKGKADNPHGAMFSPNGDNFADTLDLYIHVNEAASATIGIMPVLNSLSTQLLDDLIAGNFSDSQYMEVVSNFNLDIGENKFEWNGSINGTVLEDGYYVFIIQAIDGCGLEKFERNLTLVAFEIDTTAPQVAIEYPQSGDPMSMIVGVTASVGDRNHNTFTLSYESLMDQGRYVEIHSAQGDLITFDNQGLELPLENKVIRYWNTAGLQGEYRLHLTSVDAAGNRAEDFSTVDVTNISLLTSQFEVSPYLSVNGDGKLEQLQIRFNVLQESYVTLGIVDSNNLGVKTLLNHVLTPQGNFDVFWDGRDELATLVNDGKYRVLLGLTHAQVAGLTQNEEVGFIKDSLAPLIEYQNINHGFIAFNGVIAGSITDANLDTYTLKLRNPSNGSEILLDSASSEKRETTLAVLDLDLISEGEYQLVFEAQDFAQNTVVDVQQAFVDTSAPEIRWETPRNNHLSGKASIRVLADIQEQNPDVVHLSYAEAENPEQIHVIASLDTLSGSLDVDWDTSALESGNYLLSITAIDYAGHQTKETRTVKLDMLDPVADIVSPNQGTIISSAIDIVGSVSDVNLVEYQLLLKGANTQDMQLSVGNHNVQNSILHRLEPLPDDGEYVISLSASDKTGRNSSHEISVVIDTTPPAQPLNLVLEESAGGALLNWSDNTEADLAGYYVFQNGVRLNQIPFVVSEYVFDENFEGEFVFYVVAVDTAGLHSIASDSVAVFVDNTPPNVVITSPYDGSKVSGLVDIFGSISSNRDDIAYFRLSIAANDSFNLFTELMSGAGSQANALLAQWDTFFSESDEYIIRLEAGDNYQNTGSSEIVVLIDNKPPAQPTGLLVTSESDVAGELVSISWDENSEEDIAGYLLFRNGYLVNAQAPLVSDFNAYLISDNAYQEIISVDGEFNYFVIAVDTMGNQSIASEGVQLIINNRVPELVYISPLVNEVFDSQLLIKLVSSDHDVERVELEFREQGASLWSSLATINGAPFDFLWNTDALQQGIYEIKAVAQDTAGGVSLPVLVTVIKDNLSAPEAVSNFDVTSDGFALNLSWDASPESDFSHYLVSVWLNEMLLLQDIALNATQFSTMVLTQGDVKAEIVAVDLKGNVSQSSRAMASVFDIRSNLDHLVVESPAFVFKGETLANANVFLVIENFLTPGAPVTYTGLANADGLFEINTIVLDYGPSGYQLYAEAEGDRSVPESGFVAFSFPPETPENFSASLSDPLATVALQWDVLADPFLSGYYVFDQEGELVSSANNVPWIYLPFYTHLKAGSENSYQEEHKPENILGLYPRGFNEQACLIDPLCNPDDFINYFESSDDIWTVKISNPVEVLLDSVQVSWLDAASIPEHYKAYTLLNGVRVEIFDSKSVAGSEYISNISFQSLVPDQFVRDIYLEVVEPVYSGQLTKLAELRGTVLVPAAVNSLEYNLPASKGELEFTLIAANVFYQRSNPAVLPVSYGDTTAPELITDLLVEVNGVDVSLSWTGSSSADVVAYQIIRNGSQIAQINSTNNHQYVDTGLLNGIYEYAVISVDAFDNTGLAISAEPVVIDVGSPGVPVNLVANEDESVLQVHLSWEAGFGNPVSTYQVYRAVNHAAQLSLFAETSQPIYVDSNVQSGNRYFYSVVALDQWGNASATSDLVSAEFIDQQAPETPTIDIPAPEGSIIDSPSFYISVGGEAQEPSMIVLYKNGVRYQEMMAREGEDYDFTSAETVTLLHNTGYGDELRVKVSDTGHWLMMTRANELDGLGLHNGIWIVERSSGFLLHHVTTGYGSAPFAVTGTLLEAAWISSNEISFVELKPDHSYELKTLDVQSGVLSLDYVIPATDSSETTYNAFRFLPQENILLYREAIMDADCLCELSHLNALDLSTGIITTYWENISNINHYSFSPDASRIIYSEKYTDSDMELVRIKNRLTGLTNYTPLYSDANFVFPEFSWNDAQDKVVYFNEMHNRIELLDLNFSSTQIIRSNYSVNVVLGNPVWAGSTVLYSMTYHFGSSFPVIQVMQWDSGIVKIVEEKNLSNDVYAFGFSGYSGGKLIQYDVIDNFGLVQSNVRFISKHSGAIRYQFDFVMLDEGQNIFTTQAVDESGNASAHTLPVVVNYNLVEVNDLALSLEVSKKTALVGSELELSLLVFNQGVSYTQDTNLKVVAISEQHGFELIYSGDFESPYPGGSRALVVSWIPGKAGVYEIKAMIDEQESIHEINELNNIASESVEIFDTYDPVLTASLNTALVTTNDFMHIDVKLTNGGSEVIDDVLVISAEDLDGYLIEEIAHINIHNLAHGEMFEEGIEWQVPDIFSGEYRIVVQIAELVEQLPFTFLSERSIELNLALADSVGAFENLPVTISLMNLSSSDLFVSGRLEVNLLNSNNELIYSENKPVAYLLPDSVSEVQFFWNSGSTALGDYRFDVNLYDAFDSLLTSHSQNFSVVMNSLMVSGTLYVPAYLGSGDELPWTLNLNNQGNADLFNLDLVVSLVRKADGHESNIEVFSFNLETGEQKSLSGLFGEYLPLGIYRVSAALSLDQFGKTFARTVAESVVHIVDRTAPVVSIVSPVDGSIINALENSLIIHVLETESGIQSVEYQIDSGIWHSATFANGRYVGDLSLLSEGLHSISVQASDGAGNISTASVTFTIELDSQAPVIVITGVVNGQISQQDLTPMITVTDDHSLESVEIFLNGNLWQSGQLVFEEGTHLLDVLASDSAGNQAQATVDFTIDKTPPVITVEGVNNGVLYAQPVAPVITITDATAVSTQILLNGQNFVSNTLVTQDDVYSLHIVSIDAAGNQNTASISFEIDQTAPLAPVLIAPTQLEVINTDVVNLFGGAEPHSIVELLLFGPEGERSYAIFTNGFGIFEFNNIPVETGEYLAVLVAIDAAGNVSEELHRDFSANLATIEITAELKRSNDVLVWLPAPGIFGHNDHANITRWITFLGMVAENDNYTIVRKETDFLAALRTQQFDTLVLIGLTHSWGHPLIVSSNTQLEIRARVAAGTGFVWVNTEGQLFDQWWKLVGAKSLGGLYGMDRVEIETNAATNAYQINGANIHATRLLTFGGVGIGKIIDCVWMICVSKGHAMVLNQYGAGKSVVLGINPSLSSDETGSVAFFRDLIEYVQPNSTNDLLTTSAYRFRWSLTGVDNKDLLVSQTIVPELHYLDVQGGEQLDGTQAEWQWINPGTSDQDFRSTLLTPDSTGNYAIEVSVQELGTSTVLAETSITLDVSGVSASSREQALITALNQYSPSILEYINWSIAMNKAQQTVALPRSTTAQRQHALNSLIETIYWITLLNNNEVLVRKAGELLKVYEADSLR